MYWHFPSFLSWLGILKGLKKQGQPTLLSVFSSGQPAPHLRGGRNSTTTIVTTKILPKPSINVVNAVNSGNMQNTHVHTHAYECQEISAFIAEISSLYIKMTSKVNLRYIFFLLHFKEFHFYCDACALEVISNGIKSALLKFGIWLVFLELTFFYLTTFL